MTSCSHDVSYSRTSSQEIKVIIKYIAVIQLKYFSCDKVAEFYISFVST